MAYAKILSILFIVLLVIPHAGGDNGDEKEYISHPGNIPLFGNFSTPQMIPGDSGFLRFSLTNRYDEKNSSVIDETMTNVTVTIEIYRYANIHESKDLDRVDKVPKFASSNDQSTHYEWNSIAPGEKMSNANFMIKSREGTEQGTYFVRFQLNFDYNGTSYVMKSRGHFSNEEWDDATTNTTIDDPGNINITKLGVDGIIPDTTFGVKKPWPIWPLYVLGGLTVMFAALAILTYMYEENTNPKFTRWVHKQQRKLGEYRALLLHELRKFKKKNN